MHVLQTSKKYIPTKQEVDKNMLLARFYLQHSMPQNTEETLYNNIQIKLL